eukprot:4147246-Amphidinium_carterae.1
MAFGIIVSVFIALPLGYRLKALAAVLQLRLSFLARLRLLQHTMDFKHPAPGQIASTPNTIVHRRSTMICSISRVIWMLGGVVAFASNCIG